MFLPFFVAQIEGAALVLAAIVGAVCAFLLLQVLRALRSASEVAERQARTLDTLKEQLGRFEAERSELDLRRTEHVLIDIRDQLKGLEDAVLGALQRPAPVVAQVESAPHDPADAVLERMHNRLAALGYDRIQVVGGRELLEHGANGRTEIPLEARRAGVIHKGRCIVDKGRVLDVDMEPPYGMFP